MVHQWMNRLQFWLFPATCLLCRAPGAGYRDLCLGCHADLPYNTRACRTCAIPLEADGSLICGQCQRNPPPFQKAFAPFLYQLPVDTLIQDLKFHGRLPAARLLGDLLGDYLAQRCDALPEYIVPVPLHPARLRERGFNQALELARPVAKRLGIPIVSNAVRRARRTTPQTQLDLKNRLTNVRRAFVVARPIRAHRVAILDDVVTTGSTVAEMTRVLRRSGIEEIEVWAVARTTQ